MQYAVLLKSTPNDLTPGDEGNREGAQEDGAKRAEDRAQASGEPGLELERHTVRNYAFERAVALQLDCIVSGSTKRAAQRHLTELPDDLPPAQRLASLIAYIEASRPVQVRGFVSVAEATTPRPKPPSPTLTGRDSEPPAKRRRRLRRATPASPVFGDDNVGTNLLLKSEVDRVEGTDGVERAGENDRGDRGDRKDETYTGEERERGRRGRRQSSMGRPRRSSSRLMDGNHDSRDRISSNHFPRVSNHHLATYYGGTHHGGTHHGGSHYGVMRGNVNGLTGSIVAGNMMPGNMITERQRRRSLPPDRYDRYAELLRSRVNVSPVPDPFGVPAKYKKTFKVDPLLACVQPHGRLAHKLAPPPRKEPSTSVESPASTGSFRRTRRSRLAEAVSAESPHALAPKPQGPRRAPLLTPLPPFGPMPADRRLNYRRTNW